MYSEGEDKLEKEFDIIKIVKDLRNLNILFKKEIQKDDTQFMIENSRRNLLMLDTSDGSANDDDSQKSDFSFEH